MGSGEWGGRSSLSRLLGQHAVEGGGLGWRWSDCDGGGNGAFVAPARVRPVQGSGGLEPAGSRGVVREMDGIPPLHFPEPTVPYGLLTGVYGSPYGSDLKKSPSTLGPYGFTAQNTPRDAPLGPRRRPVRVLITWPNRVPSARQCNRGSKDGGRRRRMGVSRGQGRAHLFHRRATQTARPLFARPRQT